MKYASDAGFVAEGVGFEPTKASRPSGFQVRQLSIHLVLFRSEECLCVGIPPFQSFVQFL